MKIYTRHTITLYIMSEVGNVKLFEETMLKSTELRTMLGNLNYSYFHALQQVFQLLLIVELWFCSFK